MSAHPHQLEPLIAARAVRRQTGLALEAVANARECTGDVDLSRKLGEVEKLLRTCNLRAIKVLKEESLKHAPQTGLFP